MCNKRDHDHGDNCKDKRQKTNDDIQYIYDASGLKKYICDECDYKSLRKESMVRHKRTHSGEKPFACDFDGCDFKCAHKTTLVEHKRTHTGEKPFHCDFNGCDFTCSGQSSIRGHKKTHTGEKPFFCDVCDYKCNRARTLVNHKRTHTGEKPFHCDFEGCKFACARSNTLVSHKRTHTGEKPFHCDFEGCKFACTQSGGLTAHKMTHTGEKPFHCKFPGCDYKCSTSGGLKSHTMTHTGETPCHCDFPGCDYKCSKQSTLRRHKTTHTPEGQLRKKKQENRIHKLLQEWGYTVDCETTINASSGGCLDDTTRYFSRIDFRIVECVNMILIVEVDEEQHMWYNLSCEFARMSDIRASLVKAGYTLPIYWIRYNPNGKYHIGEDQIKTYRPERELVLKNHIEMICSSDFIPENQVNIHYMFYDLNSEIIGPSIKSDPDFPEVMNEVVSWTT